MIVTKSQLNVNFKQPQKTYRKFCLGATASNGQIQMGMEEIRLPHCVFCSILAVVQKTEALKNAPGHNQFSRQIWWLV